MKTEPDHQTEFNNQTEFNDRTEFSDSAEFDVYDLGRMSYADALVIQRKLLKLRQDNQIADTLLLVEHPPVLTLGSSGNRANIYISSEKCSEMGIEIFEVERGGDVTYHGPGQLVCYPIFKLESFPGSVRGYLSTLTDALVRLMHDEFQMNAEAKFGKLTGIWVNDQKIVAIGVAVKHGVTLHGFAFNVNTNLQHFEWINPCGLSKGVTSIQSLMGLPADFENIKILLITYLETAFQRKAMIHPLKELKLLDLL